jgi:hypothetical protein
MTVNFMNRQQRRAYEKQMKKAGQAASAPPGDKLGTMVEELNNINAQIVKMVEYNKTVYRTLTIFRETLERKGIVTIDDFKETENLYHKNVAVREQKIKELLSSPLSDDEKIQWCMREANEYRHGYDRFNISPVRDLNISPGIVNEFLSEKGYASAEYRKWATFLGVPATMQVEPEKPQPQAPQPEASEGNV